MTTTVSRLSGLAIALLLTGCVGGPTLFGPEPAPTPQSHADTAISVTREQNGKFLAFVGPKTQHTPPFLGVAGTNYAVLRSWIDTRNGEVAHQLYVEDSYPGKRRDWSGAKDGAGNTLRFIPISDEEITCDSGCSYAEEFAAALPDALMRASGNGLTVMFVAKSGAQTEISVPGAQVAAQLAAVDNAKGSLAAQLSQPPTPAAAVGK